MSRDGHVIEAAPDAFGDAVHDFKLLQQQDPDATMTITLPDRPHEYLVSSKSHPGYFAFVNTVEDTCSCTHGGFRAADRVNGEPIRARCRHLQAANDVEDAQNRELIRLKRQQRLAEQSVGAAIRRIIDEETADLTGHAKATIEMLLRMEMPHVMAIADATRG